MEIRSTQAPRFLLLLVVAPLGGLYLDMTSVKFSGVPAPELGTGWISLCLVVSLWLCSRRLFAYDRAPGSGSSRPLV
jgi:hypothetical protein